MSLNWISIILLGCLQSTSCIGKKKVFIGGLVPSYTTDRYGYETALNLATETINNSSEILKDYEVVIRYGDTFGLPSYTVRRVFEFIQWPRNESIQMMIGPAWSRNTGLSALACKSWDMVQLSYAASSVELRNDLKYPLLFTNVPATSSFNRARLSLIKRFGWKRAAVLQEYDDKLFSSAVEDLRSQILAENIDLTFITVEGFSLYTEGHPRIQLEKLQSLDARIIIGEFSPDGAVKVFCEAYKMGMFGPKYVWILSAALSGSWIFKPQNFKKTHKTVDCNVTLITQAAEGFIVIDKILIRQDNNKTISGMTASDFTREVLLRNPRARTYTSYAFDAMWTVAIMLNKSLSQGPRYHPENVMLGNPHLSFRYKELLSQTEFEGLSGPHRFTLRERQGTVHISQMRIINNQAHLVQVGRHNTFENELFLDEDEVNRLWKGGKIPTDEPRKEKRILTYSLPELIIIGIFSVVGIIYSVVFLYFNVSKRNHKVVRLSSPMINNVILLGCLFCYVFVLFLGIDSRFVNDSAFGILCNVRLYVLAIGFSLSFGALFSKTWRVHKIFTARRAIKKKMMRDVHLIVFVLFLVIIDAVFITIWVYFDPLQTVDIIFDEKKETSGDLIIIPILKICECTHRMKFLGVLYAYKGILLLFGVFIAWETRNVTIPALNDSKYIGISVYNVVILSAIGATVSIIFKKTVYFQLLNVLVSLVVLLSTTVTLTMMFLPKAHEYYFSTAKPQERVRTIETLRTSVKSTTREMDDVYEAFVKRDVKNKWIQTEAVDQVNGPTQELPNFLLEDEELPSSAVDGGVYIGDRELPRTMINSSFRKSSEAVVNGRFCGSIDLSPGSVMESLGRPWDSNGTHGEHGEPLRPLKNSGGSGPCSSVPAKRGLDKDNGELSRSVVDNGLSGNNEGLPRAMVNTGYHEDDE